MYTVHMYTYIKYVHVHVNLSCMYSLCFVVLSCKYLCHRVHSHQREREGKDHVLYLYHY